MKKIEAIIRMEKVPDVSNALEKLGVVGMTITAVKGRGSQKGITLEWRFGEYRVELIPKAHIMTVVPDGKYKEVCEAIMENAYTGAVGDGKIFVSTVDEVYRVRTREDGEVVL